jgi:hypothetical protein
MVCTCLLWWTCVILYRVRIILLYLWGIAMSTLDLNEIIKEAKKLGYAFTLEDAQDVIDTKPSWYHGEETAEEAVIDYIEAYGG